MKLWCFRQTQVTKLIALTKGRFNKQLDQREKEREERGFCVFNLSFLVIASIWESQRLLQSELFCNRRFILVDHSKVEPGPLS